MHEDPIIEKTRRWISTMVIGLELCPFARRVFDGEKIRYAVSRAQGEGTLLFDLERELKALALAPISEFETTLLIHPESLSNFFEFNEFLAKGEKLIEELGFLGVIQLASFHPNYQFANAEPDAVENYTNRSPYPMLHLLREESITKVACDPNELLEIPKRNVKTLRALGIKKILEKL